jgi:hypothetical protein
MSVLPFGSTVPPIDPANEPAAIRNGNQAAKNAYKTGLAFEQVLVSELSQELAQTAAAPDGSSDGLSGGTDSNGADTGGPDGSDSGGLMSGDPAESTYAQLLPQALTSAVMSGGGVGLAMQVARSLDPALNTPARTTSTPSAK